MHIIYTFTHTRTHTQTCTHTDSYTLCMVRYAFLTNTKSMDYNTYTKSKIQGPV